MAGRDRSDSSASTAIGHDGEQRLRDGHSASTPHPPVQPQLWLYRGSVIVRISRIRQEWRSGGEGKRNK